VILSLARLKPAVRSRRAVTRVISRPGFHAPDTVSGRFVPYGAAHELLFSTIAYQESRAGIWNGATGRRLLSLSGGAISAAVP
jgi:hypothetical protein